MPIKRPRLCVWTGERYGVPISRILPSVLNLEARIFQEFANSIVGEFVAVLRMDGFPLVELKIKVGGFDPDLLASHAFEMHLDPRIFAVPQSTMPKSSTIKIRIEFPVEPFENVQIERRRYPLSIVVSGYQRRFGFNKICSEKQCIIVSKL
jgi:hypothetical protein